MKEAAHPVRARTVTSDPKRQNAWPHSRPIAPAPITARRRGSLVKFHRDEAVR